MLGVLISKKRKGISLIAVSIALLSGCSATHVMGPSAGVDSKYSPVNERERTGVVRYLNKGADFVIKSRRNDAYKKMYESCNGKYKIVNESVKDGDLPVYSISNIIFLDRGKYVFIEYRCIH